MPAGTNRKFVNRVVPQRGLARAVYRQPNAQAMGQANVTQHQLLQQQLLLQQQQQRRQQQLLQQEQQQRQQQLLQHHQQQQRQQQLLQQQQQLQRQQQQQLQRQQQQQLLQQQQQQQHRKLQQNVTQFQCQRVQTAAQNSQPVQVVVQCSGEPMTMKLATCQQIPKSAGNQSGTPRFFVLNQNTAKKVVIQVPPATPSQSVVESQPQSQQTRPFKQVSLPVKYAKDSQGRTYRLVVTKDSNGQSIGRYIPIESSVTGSSEPQHQVGHMVTAQQTKTVAAQETASQQQSVSLLRTSTVQSTGKRQQQAINLEGGKRVVVPQKAEPTATVVQRCAEPVQTELQVDASQQEFSRQQALSPQQLLSQQQTTNHEQDTSPHQNPASNEPQTPNKLPENEHENPCCGQGEGSGRTKRARLAKEVEEELLPNLEKCVGGGVAQKAPVHLHAKQLRTMLEDLRTEGQMQLIPSGPLKLHSSIEELWQDEFEEMETQVKCQKRSIAESAGVVSEHFGRTMDVPWWMKRSEFLSEWLDEGSCSRTPGEKQFLAQCCETNTQELKGNGTRKSLGQLPQDAGTENMEDEMNTYSAPVVSHKEDYEELQTQSPLHDSVRELDSFKLRENSCHASNYSLSLEQMMEIRENSEQIQTGHNKEHERTEEVIIMD